MLSAVILSVLSYPAMLLAEQLEHQRYVHSGPLVLRAALINIPTPTSDRDQTVSRRFEPRLAYRFNGRTAQPLEPTPGSRMRWADIEVPNLAVDVISWARLACYPQGNFYPLSDCHSTMYSRITKSCFRTCSTCMSHSQAHFCLCALHTVSDRTECTFERLRYSLGGRPPQSNYPPRTVLPPDYDGKLEIQHNKGGISRLTPLLLASQASKSPTYPTHVRPNSNTKL